MTSDKVEQKLRTILAKVFNIRKESISEETSMDSIDSWDSLTHLRLLSEVEEEFNIELSTEDIIEMTSYNKIVKKIIESDDNK